MVMGCATLHPSYCTAPGAFLARALLRHIPAGVHAWFMEAVVIAGALALLWHAKG